MPPAVATGRLGQRPTTGLDGRPGPHRRRPRPRSPPGEAADPPPSPAPQLDRSGEEALPAWVDRLPARPTVYATLGTVFNDAPDLFRAIVAGLGDLPLNLIVTVGRDGDPAAFGPQPANVRIERYVPQSLLFEHCDDCDAVVCHAGWNTVLAALCHGLPMVLLPLGADQPWNAERGTRLGVGRLLAPPSGPPRRSGPPPARCWTARATGRTRRGSETRWRPCRGRSTGWNCWRRWSRSSGRSR